MTSVSDTSRRRPSRDSRTARVLAWPPRHRCLLGGVAGEREEHVVEGRAAHARGRRRRFRRRSAGGPPRRSRRCARATLSLQEAVARRCGGSSDIGASARIGGSGSAASSRRHLQPLAADAVLELVGGALGDQRAVVDHRDRVGEPVGLIEVLGGQQHRRAVGDAAPRSPPRGARRLRGSRPVVGSSRNSTGGCATRAAARSRRRRMPPE